MEIKTYSFLDTYEEMVCSLLEKENVPYKLFTWFDMPETDEVCSWKCQGTWPIWSETCDVECSLPEARFQEIVDEASKSVPLKKIEVGYYRCVYRMGESTPEWIPKPTRVFSGWQSLNGKTDEEKVDCFLLSLLAYNQSRFERLHKGLKLNWALTDKDMIIPEMIALMDKGHIVLGGGLAFHNRTAGLYMADPITPGCCGGLEDWHENVLEMKNKRISPWMGHDPYVSLVVFDGDPVITKGDYPESEYSADPFIESTTSEWIRFRPDEFDEQLGNVETEFEEFMNGPLKKRIEILFPEYAGDFMSSFRYCFDRVDDESDS